MNRKVLSTILSMFVVLSFVLAACAPKATPTEPPQVEATEPPTVEPTKPAVQPKPSGVTPGQELQDALAGKFKGTVVTMAGPFTNADAVKFDNSIKAFEDQTGIDIQYEGSKEFEAAITIRVDGGNPPVMDVLQL